MSAPASPRPRQVTVTAWIIVAASAFTVLTQISYLPSLSTLDMREQVEMFLAEPPGSGFGLTTRETLDLLRVLALVAAGCATATAILGYYVLQRSASARWGLTVLALPVLVSGMPSAGLLAAVIAAGAAMLWAQPARAWYAGEPIPEPRVRQPRPPAPPVRPVDRPVDQPLPPSPSAPQPPPYPNPYAKHLPPQQATQQNPYAYGTPAAPSPVAPLTRRPGALVAACVLTWVLSGLTAAMLAVLGLAVAADGQGLIDEAMRRSPQIADSGVDRDALLTGVLVLAVVGVVWSLMALALAVLTFLGSRWARIALTVSAAAAGVVLLLGVVGSPPAIVPAIGAFAVVALLQQTEVRRWCTQRR